MQKKPTARQTYSAWREALRGSTLGWELALPIFGGVLVGYYLDNRLATGHVFTMGLMTLGLGASAYSLWRFIQQLDAQQKETAPEAEDTQRG